LTDAFFRFLPWINILGLLQIVFNGFLLGQRTWTPVTRAFGVLMDIVGMILAVVILRTPGIFGITPAALAQIGSAETANDLSRLFSFLPTIIITIVVIVTAIKVIKSLLRLFSNRASSPYPMMK
jgi:hypothetical protein